MSEEIIGSCINHNDIRHLRVYHDYMLIYDGNEHKAKIIRILEAWTNTKRAAWYKAAYDHKEQGKPAPVPDFWITMSHQQFSEYMYGTSKPDTIKKNLKELVEKDKHIERRINPEEPYGPPQYRLNVQAVQKKIDELAPVPFLPEIPEIEESSPSEKHTPPGKATPGRGVGNTPTQGGNLPVPQGGKTATSNNSNYNTGKNKEITSDDIANANHHDTPASFSFESFTTKEKPDGPPYRTSDHRSNSNANNPLPALSDPQGLIGDPHGGTPAQQQRGAAGVGTHTSGDNTGQPTDTMTVPPSTIPASVDVHAPTLSVPVQTNNDRVENATPSVAPLTAFTGDTPSPDHHRIASETQQPDDEKRENATVGGGVPTVQSTPPESSAKGQSAKPGKTRTPRVTTPMPAIVLTPDEQAFYDLYCSMPWIKVAPEITAKVKEHCGKLAPHLKTQEQMYSLRKFMNGKDFFKGKGFNLPLVVMALNDWAMTQEPIDLEERRNEARKDASVNIGTQTVVVTRPKETETERHNRELRERFSNKKVIGQ